MAVFYLGVPVYKRLKKFSGFAAERSPDSYNIAIARPTHIINKI